MLIVNRIFKLVAIIPRRKFCTSNNLRYASCTSPLIDKNTLIVKSPFSDVKQPLLPIHQYIWENIDNWNNHTAIECAITGKSYTYKELRGLCKKLAFSLRKLGLKAGKNNISLVIPNCPDFVIAYLGALELGVKVNPINPAYTADEIVHQLEEVESDCVFCHPWSLEAVQKAIGKSQRRIRVILTSGFDEDGKTATEPLGQGVTPLSDLVGDDVHPSNFEQVDIDVAETAVIAYSSGTTGVPKGTCLTHKSITMNLEQLCAKGTFSFIQCSSEYQEVLPAVLPFFHCYGNIVILLLGLRTGGKIISIPKFDPKVFIDILSKEQKNVSLLAVPPIVFFLGSSPDVKKEHLLGLNKIGTGAAPCSPSDIEKVHKKHYIPILQAYGMTEASPVLTIMPQGSKMTAPVGQLMPNTLGRVIDMTTGRSLPPNEIGELLFKGPQLMKGYLKNEKATKETIDEEGWLHTGDVGYYDEEGYFYVTDRLKELIKVKGFQVAPAELEDVLRQYPGVSEAGVVGVPCPKSGETPVAFVSLTKGKGVRPEDLLEFANEKISKHKQISKLFIVETIPKTPSGKILRKELKVIAQKS